MNITHSTIAWFLRQGASLLGATLLSQTSFMTLLRRSKDVTGGKRDAAEFLTFTIYSMCEGMSILTSAPVASSCQGVTLSVVSRKTNALYYCHEIDVL
jgi:hypothetical protein